MRQFFLKSINKGKMGQNYEKCKSLTVYYMHHPLEHSYSRSDYGHALIPGSFPKGTGVILVSYCCSMSWNVCTHQFDLFCTSIIFIFCGPPTLLRPKPYYDLNFSTNKKSRFDKMPKYRGRSTRVEVERSK